MAPLIVDKDQKKAQIAQAALRVFARQGTAKTKIADVAIAAGIGKGTIYEYFESKDALIEYAMHHFFEEINRDVGAQVFLLTDPREKLSALIHTTVQAFGNMGEEGRFLLEVWAEGIRDGKQYFDVKGFYTQYRAMIKAIIDEGIRQGLFGAGNPVMTASIITGALDGLALQWVLDEDCFTLKEAADGLCDLVLKGLAPEKASDDQ